MAMFSFNQNAGETPESIARHRKIADALAIQAMDASPIQHWTQGMARVAAGLGAGMRDRRAAKGELALKNEAEGKRKAASDSFSKVVASLMGGQPQTPPAGNVAQPGMAPMAPGGDTFQKMIQVESGGNPNAVSPKGATGIAQVMPATARDPGFGVPNIFDFAKKQGVQVADNSDATLQALLKNPQVNAGFGEAYFNAQKQRYGGDERLAAAAYNAGPGAVDKAGGVPNIPETQAYVQKLGLNGGQQPQVQPAGYQQPQPAAVQQAGQGGGDMSALVGLLSDPNLNEQQQGVLASILKQRMTPADPMQALEMQKARLELQNLQNPKPIEVGGRLVDPRTYKPVYEPPTKPDYITARDGSVLAAGPDGVKVVYGSQPEPIKPTADIQEYEYAKNQGFQGSFQDFQLAVKKAGASQVNIDQKAEGAFDKKLAENQATSFDSMATDGMNAKADLGVLGELETLMAGQGGTMTGLSGALAKYGIGGEGIDDVQAAQALINKLIPTQRQPGSGSMSDRDVEMFTRSLPSLWNTPGGNVKIMNVMKGLAQYKQAQGEIAQRVMTGELNRQDAVKELRALPNPLAPANGKPAGDDLDSLLKKYGG